MSYTNILFDFSQLTPMDLWWAGIAIERTETDGQGGFHWRAVDSGDVGAMHDTARQAELSARRCFGVYPDIETEPTP